MHICGMLKIMSCIHAIIVALTVHLHEDDSEADKLHSSAGCSSKPERQQKTCTESAEMPSRLASTTSNSDIVFAYKQHQQ